MAGAIKNSGRDEKGTGVVSWDARICNEAAIVTRQGVGPQDFLLAVRIMMKRAETQGEVRT
jgi:hypothetical protein